MEEKKLEFRFDTHQEQRTSVYLPIDKAYTIIEDLSNNYAKKDAIAILKLAIAMLDNSLEEH